ncbi:potassium-transporting ATPase subunit KdpA, partial [Escherichia coli]|uniref:potassium-transporting ATPase subunit KdpA n=1 Tax=Escherichia coli TaxID=562 RepID=UPI00126EB067
LYAVSSDANNNGSDFAGLRPNSQVWNCLQAFGMFVGRFGVVIPVMAIAGSLLSQKSLPARHVTLPTQATQLVRMAIATQLMVG